MTNVIPFPTPEKDNFQLVFDFFDAFEVPQNEASQELYRTLIVEEAKEVHEAATHLLKELADLAYVITGHINLGGDPMEAIDLATSIVDEDVLDGLVEAFMFNDIDDAAFNLVHASNMSKLVDGKAVRRPSDGKVLKGPFYLPPDLSSLISPHAKRVS